MKTKTLIIHTPDEIKALQQAAHLLDEGALVAFPTETVYGIGCKVDPKTIQRLNELKNRPIDKHYTLHIGNYEQLAKYVPVMSARARKLVHHAFPGPVTIVFELSEKNLKQLGKSLPAPVMDLLYRDGTLGVRYPAHPVACAILSQTQFPIVAPSANVSGQPPAVNAEQVAGYFEGQIDCIVDVPLRDAAYNKSSTVVKVGQRDIQILRQGAVPAEKIREWTTLRILFVCTGNTCRSPMAAGFCRKYFADILGCSVDELSRFGYIINSAGIAAFEGVPASRDAVEICRQQRIDVTDHRSRPLTLDEIEKSDIIYVMSQSHWENVVRLLPSAKDKCFVLDRTGDIDDPVGWDRDVYQECFNRIKKAITGRTNEIL
jgi:tRNA threonylcarbamoyl adenosine modification protein (Sua5/YciO/YrdC/YwlC family)